MEYILVTGGFGYIGSHTVIELLNNNYNIIVIDDLSNSSRLVKDHIETITGRSLINFTFSLCTNLRNIQYVFKNYKIVGVIHFAGFKSVLESINNPLKYYKNNLLSTINLLQVMKEYKCYNLIFSSSATVYGNQMSPVTENLEIGNGITNPYGRTKCMIEDILIDICKSNELWNIISLRYFNPIGAHNSGLIGETPNNMPTNLMPVILRSIQDDDTLLIYGYDYNTSDGTCIRDFIHVVDLAQAHVSVLQKLITSNTNNGYNYYNVGTGVGTSVLNMITTFEKVNNIKLKYELSNRRNGDICIVYADTTKILTDFGWTSQLSIEDMCIDTWNFYKKNAGK
jgi:UDP-glucose 4-epimerase